MIVADFYDGRSSRRHAVTLSFAAGSIIIAGEFGQRSCKLAQTRIREDTGRGISSIELPDGALCEVRDTAALASQLAGAGRASSVVARAERNWHWALAALAGAIVAIVAGYAIVLPWLAERLAPMIPDAVTQSISGAVLEGLESRLLAPSKLTAKRQAEIAAKVADLADAGGGLPPHRLLFRAGPAIGPNAFVLPGGEMVLLDELVALAKSDEHVVAVVAHELGHLQYRHGMRQLLQSAVVSFVVGVYLGDVSTVAASLATLLLDSRYSRQFERQADLYAAHLLLATTGSVEPLVEMLQRLDEAHDKRRAAPRDTSSNVADLLSSHPDTAARIEALRAMPGR